MAPWVSEQPLSGGMLSVLRTGAQIPGADRTHGALIVPAGMGVSCVMGT